MQQFKHYQKDELRTLPVEKIQEYEQMKSKMLTTQDYDAEILQCRKELKKFQERIEDLSMDRKYFVFEDMKPLEELIKRYQGGDPWPDPPRHYGYETLTVLSRHKLPKDLKKKTDYLFPYKEAGYFGASGYCVLIGKVEFTAEEQELLKRYGVRWSHQSGHMSS